MEKLKSIKSSWAHIMVKPDTAKTIAIIKAKENNQRPYNVTNDIIIREALEAYKERIR